MIKGRTVNLRKISVSADMPKIFEWYQDKELMKYYDELPVGAYFEIEHILRQNMTANDRIDFIIETKKNEQIGRLYLNRINWADRNLEIHTMIGEKNKRNYFFGAEAAFLALLYSFHQLGMHKVYGRLLEYANEAESLQKELGFTKEAVLKKRYFQKGRYQDAVLYGLLDREFETFLGSPKGQKYLAASQGCFQNGNVGYA